MHYESLSQKIVSAVHEIAERFINKEKNNDSLVKLGTAVTLTMRAILSKEGFDPKCVSGVNLVVSPYDKTEVTICVIDRDGHECSLEALIKGERMRQLTFVNGGLSHASRN